MTTLLLWDIDGTLLASTGAGIRALQDAVRQIYRVEDDLTAIEIAGRTDRLIARDIVAHFARDADHLVAAQRLLEGYLAALPAQLAAGGSHILPGVQELITAGKTRPGIMQALLTGNLQAGAKIKLGAAGIADYFAFGAFADDSMHRDELGPHALARACALAGEPVLASRTWIIGDTPHDIACAKAIGAHVLAVATGHFTVAQLAAHQPDAVLPDLSDTTNFWKIVSG